MRARRTGYIELHSSSAFSFLEAASLPEELAAKAAHLEYPALALLDRDGVHGAPRFYKACRDVGVRPLVGSEVTMDTATQARLALLVKNRVGYQNLCKLITTAKLRAAKGDGACTVQELEQFSDGLVCLAGGRNCFLRQAPKDSQTHRRRLEQLRSIYTSQNLYIELQRHFDRHQERLNQGLIELAQSLQIPLIATNGVRHSRPTQRPLLDILTCIHHRTTLQRAGKLLSQNTECYLKSPQQMEKLFADIPETLFHTQKLAEQLEFTLEDLGYRFPDYPVPTTQSMHSYLRFLVEKGARKRYRPYHARARRQINRELDLIEKLDLAGYFLIVWDIVQFCKRKNILVQGRGSAANSAVCYSLEITAVDPVGMDLLFERFLSEERGEWPDIDLDLPSGDRRERVIQYVYQRYGTRGAAMTANVITYRAKSAAREVGKVLGIQPPILARLSRLLTRWGCPEETVPQRFQEAGLDLSKSQTTQFLSLWKQIQDLPRHLGQHSGGLVICQGRLDSVVPLENASMPGRRVVQWDKEDCADLGIIKVDLLGLGMMSVLQDSIEMLSERDCSVDLAHLPMDDQPVYDLLQKADTVGVFQVESRAQMATLPRLKPSCFYDLVVEVAIIRPGPIVGQMVHPYIKRRAGLEPISYPHPSLEPILKRTLGVALFQEQLLKIAMVAAGFSGGEAEELRRALGFKRSEERMHKIQLRLQQGLQERGIGGEAADTIIRYITSFALYGFPESHAASFALLAYASAYLKVHYPEAFYAALLNNQPMGFYHPATLVKDAQHRGQTIRPIDIQLSGWLCHIETDKSIRLGLCYASSLRKKIGQTLEEDRNENGPFKSLQDLKQRVALNKREIQTLAEIGALNSLGMKRREALWQVSRILRKAGPLLEKVDRLNPDHGSPLRDMDAEERLIADYRGSGLTLGPHPLAFRRAGLQTKGVWAAGQLAKLKSGQSVRVAGAVIVRQRPVTAKGFFFMSLEDETGISNIVIQPQLFGKYRTLLVSQPFLVVEGILQNDEVISLLARKFWPLQGFRVENASHDFC